MPPRFVLEPVTESVASAEQAVDTARGNVAGALPPDSRFVLEPETAAAPPGLMDRIRGAVKSADVGGKYQALREGVTKGINLLDMPGTRAALQERPPGEVYNPLPHSLSSGLAQTAVGAFLPVRPGGAPWVTARPGVTGAAQRVGAATVGGEVGGQLEGKDTGTGALEGGGPVAAAEVAGPVASWLTRSAPYIKARINEGQSQDLLGQLRRTNRVAGEAVDAAPVSPLQQQPRTAAALKRGFESGAVEDAASGRFGQTLDRVAAAAGNPTVNGPALQRAYDAMPSLAQEQIVGAVGPGGFTLQQAQAVRSWLGGSAFSQSPLGQGVGKVPQQRLWGEATQEIEGALAGTPRALQLWRANNRAYSGTEAMQEALTERSAFITQPNRTFLNRSSVSDYFARNEVDLVRRLGREGYDRFIAGVLRGGQPGTRDLLTSGSGSPLDALRETYGRGRGGAPQILGSAIRTGLPNVGSQYTGRAPYSLDAAGQSILDLIGQKGTDEVLR